MFRVLYSRIPAGFGAATSAQRKNEIKFYSWQSLMSLLLPQSGSAINPYNQITHKRLNEDVVDPHDQLADPWLEMVDPSQASLLSFHDPGAQTPSAA